MGHTLAEKIIMKNTGLADLHPGDLVTVTPDRAVVHDIYTKSLYEKLMEMGFEKAMYPERLIIFHDHLNPACLPTDPDSLSYGSFPCFWRHLPSAHPRAGLREAGRNPPLHRLPHDDGRRCRLLRYGHWIYGNGILMGDREIVAPRAVLDQGTH